MKKQIFAIILSIAMVLTAIPSPVLATEPPTDNGTAIELTYYEKVINARNIKEIYALMNSIENESELNALSTNEITAIIDKVAEIATSKDEDVEIEILTTLYNLPNAPEMNGTPEIIAENNVYNATQKIWYGYLTAAIDAAKSGDTLVVYKSTTETGSRSIDKNLTIKAAPNTNVTVTWTAAHIETDDYMKGRLDHSSLNTANCLYIRKGYTVNLGENNSTGTLTLKAGNIVPQRKPRVIKSYGTLNMYDGIVITGGDPFGLPYTTASNGETVTFGSGIFVGGGTFNMYGGTITENDAHGQASAIDKNSPDYHEEVGGGGGVYVHGVYNVANSGATFNFYDGIIKTNTAGSGGGGGVLVGYGAKFNMSGGIIEGNRTDSASGGGIGVRMGATVNITGGIIRNNYAVNAGGGIFARGDQAETLDIKGVKIYGNQAGSIGGGVLFWTVGKDEKADKLIISSGEIYNNTAPKGAGIYVGREVLKGEPIGELCWLEVKGGKIYNNHATNAGGGIYLESICNVLVSGGEITGNKADKNGGAIYVANGKCDITGGTIDGGTVDGYNATNGGGIYINGGIFSMTKGSITKCSASNNGGGVYVNNSSVTFGGNTSSVNISENSAVNGGGFYLNQDDTTEYTTIISNGSIDNNIVTGNGGGLYQTGAKAKCTLKGEGSISGNSAVNGGAIYVANGSELTVSGGIVTKNKAAGNPENSIDSSINDNGNKGVGGGIYVASESAFIMKADNNTPVGIYSNLADFAADDVYANGTNTKLDVPDVNGMKITGEAANATGWFEDYCNDDTKYNVGLNGNSTIGGIRYRQTSNAVSADINDINRANMYICATIGVRKEGSNELTIKKAGNSVTDDQWFIFKIEGTTALTNEHIEMEVSILGKGSATIFDLPDGTYSITEIESNSWRYTCENITLDGVTIPMNNSGCTITLGNNDNHNREPEIIFTNKKDNDTWLDGNSEPIVNIYGIAKN